MANPIKNPVTKNRDTREIPSHAEFHALTSGKTFPYLDSMMWYLDIIAWGMEWQRQEDARDGQ